MTGSVPFTLLESSRWTDYALLDSGDGLKLERFGKYVFVRPESQAMWKRSLDHEWRNAHAVFVPAVRRAADIGISKRRWMNNGNEIST
jgi:23S rRNA G2069 N7-methylase RlmK/C1962 C5-methylase RlmI